MTMANPGYVHELATLQDYLISLSTTMLCSYLHPILPCLARPYHLTSAYPSAYPITYTDNATPVPTCMWSHPLDNSASFWPHPPTPNHLEPCTMCADYPCTISTAQLSTRSPPITSSYIQSVFPICFDHSAPCMQSYPVIAWSRW